MCPVTFKSAPLSARNVAWSSYYKHEKWGLVAFCRNIFMPHKALRPESTRQTGRITNPGESGPDTLTRFAASGLLPDLTKYIRNPRVYSGFCN